MRKIFVILIILLFCASFVFSYPTWYNVQQPNERGDYCASEMTQEGGCGSFFSSEGNNNGCGCLRTDSGHVELYCCEDDVGGSRVVCEMHSSSTGEFTVNVGGYIGNITCAPECIPSCTPACGQGNGCSGTCGTVSRGDGVQNFCDSSDVCTDSGLTGTVISTGLYNPCPLITNTSCGVESNPSQCDSIDNDCDGIIDNGFGMECVQDIYSNILPNWRNGDCTSTCTVCQDNKIIDINFFSVDNESDNNALNYFMGETMFRVEVKSESPNDCILGYEYELFYKDEFSSWLPVRDWDILTGFPADEQESTFGTNGFRQSAINTIKDSFEFSMRYMPVGRNYLVKVKVIDEKNERNKSGFVYSDNEGASSNIIKVINSQPRKPTAILERVGTIGNFDLNCSISQINDEDVFTPYGSQDLMYYGRIFEIDSVSGAFVNADSSNRVFVDLINERTYCCEVKANDAVIDSEIFNTCSDQVHAECELEDDKISLPQGEGVIIGNNFYPISFFGDSVWNYSAEKNPLNLNYCQWGCADGYDISIDTLYSCDRITENACELPDGKTILPYPNVVLGDTTTIESLTWTYTSNSVPGVCKWNCSLGAVLDDSSYGCMFENQKTCLAPSGQSGLPNGFVEIGSNNFIGNDKEWTYVVDYDKDLEACEWRCQNESDYSLDDSGYGCSSKIVSPFTPNCSDMGIVLVSQSSKIEDGKTKIELNVSCKDASFRIVNEEIIINKILFLSSNNTVLYSQDLSLECERATNTSIKVVLDLNEAASYSYSVGYGISFFGKDINCLYNDSIVVISEKEESSIPDSNLFVVLLAILIVSIILVKPIKKK